MKIKKIILLTLVSLFTSLTIVAQQPGDSVTILITLELPEDTPQDDSLFWAGTINYWHPGAEGSGFSAKDLSMPFKKVNGKWSIELKSTLDDTVEYKITRGSIYSSEEKSDHSFRPHRKLIFDEDKSVTDTVEAWHDIPQAGFENLWPEVSLSKDIDKEFKRGERSFEWFGTILYANDLVRYYYGDKIVDNLKEVPAAFVDTVIYYQQISKAPDNTFIVAAGKTQKDKPWQIFIDKNNDNRITQDEHILTERDSVKLWRGEILFDEIFDGDIIQNSTEVEIEIADDLPAAYTSSNRKNAPDLTFMLPSQLRKGTLKAEEDSLNFYLLSIKNSLFTEHLEFLLDLNDDDILQLGSGTNELLTVRSNHMRASNKYYQYTAIEVGNRMFEIADIDPHGSWVRFRPSFAESRDEIAAIEIGSKPPKWEAKTVDDIEISSQSLQGKYVLLDFWGSWCGPCIEEIPILKDAFKEFNSNKFQLVGIALDNPTSLEAAIDKYNLEWPQILDNGEMKNLFRIQGYPFQLLINPEGTIVEMGSSLRGEKLQKTLSKYLK